MKKPKKIAPPTEAPNPKEIQQKKDKADFLAQLALKPILSIAARHIKKDITTIWEWRKKDEEFHAAIEAVLKTRTPLIVDALFNAAMRGNVTAQIFYLVNKTRMEEVADRWESVNRAEPLATERLRKLPFIVAGDPNDPTPPDKPDHADNPPAQA